MQTFVPTIETNTKGPLVFVYGSLRKGLEFHKYLTAEPHQYLGEFKTKPKYDMQLAMGGGGRIFPTVKTGGRTSILGEVYRITNNTLKVLDRIEGHPILYKRQMLNTPFGLAWIYLFSQENIDMPKLVTGDWMEVRKLFY